MSAVAAEDDEFKANKVATNETICLEPVHDLLSKSARKAR
jgi:hypothetical protein